MLTFEGSESQKMLTFEGSQSIILTFEGSQLLTNQYPRSQTMTDETMIFMLKLLELEVPSRQYISFSRSIWFYQLGDPGLFIALKLMDLYRKPSMSPYEQAANTLLEHEVCPPQSTGCESPRGSCATDTLSV